MTNQPNIKYIVSLETGLVTLIKKAANLVLVKKWPPLALIFTVKAACKIIGNMSLTRALSSIVVYGITMVWSGLVWFGIAAC